jgi:hypothetical protein
MEQNPMSFEQRVEEEQRARYAKMQGRPSFRPDTPEEKLKDLQRQADYAINQNFSVKADALQWSPVRLLALPGMMARQDTLGTNVAMRILQATKLESEEDFDLVLRQIGQGGLPTIQHIANLLVTDHYSAPQRNLAECYWLLKLSKWISCYVRPDFEEAMEAAMRPPSAFRPSFEPEPIKVKHIEFNQVAPPVRRPGLLGRMQGYGLEPHRSDGTDFITPLVDLLYDDHELVQSSTKQYRALELWLRRL